MKNLIKEIRVAATAIIKTVSIAFWAGLGLVLGIKTALRFDEILDLLLGWG